VSAHFLLFGVQKMRFDPTRESKVRGYPALCELIFCIFAIWKCGWRRRLTPSVGGHPASCKQQENATRADSWSPRFVATRLRVRPFSAFWRPENSVRTDSWRHGSRPPGFVWAYFLHFGRLKMRLQPTRDAHGSRPPCFVWAHFLHFGGLENAIPAELWNPRSTG